MNKYLKEAQTKAQTDLNELAKQVKLKENQLQALNKNLDAREKRFNQLVEQIETDYQKKLKDNRHELAIRKLALNEQIEAKHTELMAIKKEVSINQIKIKELYATLTQLETKIEDTTLSNERFTDEYENNKKVYAEQIAHAEKRFLALQQQEDKLNSTLSNISNEIINAEKHIQEVRTAEQIELERHNEAIKVRRQMEDQYQTKLRHLKVEIEQLEEAKNQTIYEKEEFLKELEVRENAVQAKLSAFAKEKQEFIIEKRQFYSTRSMLD
jgi:chromosome segregation ATPase